jgi:putative Mn2+ efflux pump MntP
MSFGAIFLLALGLAMDAMAVAATRGLAASAIRPRHVILVASFFGGFQALMPLLGWLAGSRMGPLVAAWNHWIAFVLLVAIGGKMLAEGGNREKKETPHSDDDLFGPKVLFILALAAGLTLPMLGAPMGLSLATIGLTTAVLSAIGLFAGRLFGASLGRRLDFAGGVVLIGLGIKILVQHLRGA